VNVAVPVDLVKIRGLVNVVNIGRATEMHFSHWAMAELARRAVAFRDGIHLELRQRTDTAMPLHFSGSTDHTPGLRPFGPRLRAHS